MQRYPREIMTWDGHPIAEYMVPYVDFLMNSKLLCTNTDQYKLVFIDNDDIPEMIIEGQEFGFLSLTQHDGRVSELRTAHQNFLYIPDSGICGYFDGEQNRLFQIQDGKFLKLSASESDGLLAESYLDIDSCAYYGDKWRPLRSLIIHRTELNGWWKCHKRTYDRDTIVAEPSGAIVKVIHSANQSQWLKAYTQFIVDSNIFNNTNYHLWGFVYVDDDSIPELFVQPQNINQEYLLSWHDGKVTALKTSGHKMMYIPNSGLCCAIGDSTDIIRIFELKDDGFSVIGALDVIFPKGDSKYYYTYNSTRMELSKAEEKFHRIYDSKGESRALIAVNPFHELFVVHHQ